MWHAWGGRLCLESYRKPQNLLRELFFSFCYWRSASLQFLPWFPFHLAPLSHSVPFRPFILCNQLGNSIEYVISGYSPILPALQKVPTVLLVRLMVLLTKESDESLKSLLLIGVLRDWWEKPCRKEMLCLLDHWIHFQSLLKSLYFSLTLKNYIVDSYQWGKKHTQKIYAFPQSLCSISVSLSLIYRHYVMLLKTSSTFPINSSWHLVFRKMFLFCKF